ncbi:MAG: hypothetical protein IT449_08605 [Phycisphaerales bacterium]|nr:hypothetical protein [Phycisphaerales bacterium]
MMELPVHDPNAWPNRSAAEVRALAIVIQANLVQLKIAAQRRPALQGAIRGIDVVPPGAVTRMREAMIPPERMKACTDGELLLRLHEAWGQYCLMCWAHETGASAPTLNFGLLPADTEIHCDAALRAKEAEVHALLWRLRHEQRRRERTGMEHGSIPPEAAGVERMDSLARRIPAEALGTPAGEAGDTELLLAACQHAGMLAVLRWLLHPGKDWGDPALMQVEEWPF